MIRRETGPLAIKAAEEGFTLLELLVSLALLAIMAVTMSQVIAQLRPMQAFQQRMRDTDVADAIVNVIERDLQSALRLPLIEDGGASSLVLRGEPQRIRFSAIVPTGFQRRGLREVTYELLGSSNGVRRLVRNASLRRLATGSGVTRSEEEEELWSGPLDLQFSYLQGSETGTEQWRDEFSIVNERPRAVAIRLSIPGARAIQSSRIVVVK